MNARREVIQILHAELVRLQTANPRYSLRGFARRLGVTSPALSEIMSAKRKLTRQQAAKFLNLLLIEPERQRTLLDGIAEEDVRKKSIKWLKKPAKTPIETRDGFTQVDLDIYRTVSEWYYFAILALMDTKSFVSDAAWIAKRLRISVRDVRVALERLERLEMIKRDAKTGRLTSTGKQFRTPTDIADLSIRKFHHQNLELAKHSLDHDAVEDRDFSAITMTVDRKLLPEAKKMIRAFRYALSDFLESSPAKDDVYRVSIQMIPLTKDKL